MGTALALMEGQYDVSIFILALLTTVGFQITSNFANDYGDGVKGTDDSNRIGPARALQAGLLSRTSLKKGIIVSVAITFIIALLLIIKAFGWQNVVYIFVFVCLGALSLWAAIKYTMGDNPYGYRGMGDISVFLFFGLLGVLGSMFLYTKHLNWNALLPAITIGFLCVGVLNLNNLRDVVSDKYHGKKTLIVLMGFKRGKVYHFFLISLAFLSMALFSLTISASIYSYFYLLVFVPIFLHLVKVMKVKEPKLLDPELKKLALSTFLLSILFIISVNYFL